MAFVETNLLFRRTKTLVLLAGGILLFAQCTKSENTYIVNPTWYDKGNAHYYYDLDSAGKIIRNFSVIEVRQTNPGELEFVERIQYPTRFVYSSLTNLGSIDLFTQEEGLFAEYQTTCDATLFNTASRYLLVPLNPKTGQQIPLYGCSQTLYGTDTIATTEETITVPAGTFKTFSIAHFNGDRSWWQQAIGLVQYETSMKVDTGNVFLRVTLKLRKVENY